VEPTAFSIALVFFLVANPIGNSPAILSLVKDYSFERQQKIILREAVISLIIVLFFQFFGEIFLGMLKISDYALTLTGGLVLFMVALQMIFHKPEIEGSSATKQEPFIVPIATPLISGPGVMTMVMISAKEANDNIKITLAILIAWAGVISILAASPYLQKLIGKRGMAALEQIMGMLLGLISMGMIINGVKLFLKTLNQA